MEPKGRYSCGYDASAWCQYLIHSQCGCLRRALSEDDNREAAAGAGCARHKFSFIASRQSRPEVPTLCASEQKEEAEAEAEAWLDRGGS